MKMRTLGRTGIKVSPYCLGTMMFASAGNSPVRHRRTHLESAVVGLLTGKYSSGSTAPISPGRKKWGPKHMSDQAKFAAVEQLLPLAEEAGMSLTHMAMAFVLAHPQVTSAIIGPRTMEQLDDLLAGSETSLDDDILDRIDEVAPPGADIGVFDIGYQPPAIQQAGVRRRAQADRSAV